MTRAQRLSWIARARTLGSKPGLTRIRALLSALGLPEKGMTVIHVTGTNGKGSTSAAIAAGLSACGLCTGRFSSPELFDPRERILVGEKPITERELCLAADEVYPAAEAMADPPTEYELFMALALAHFRRRGVTHAVIEACMGGARDVTNVFSDTAVCAFTPVSLDHTAQLGPTLADIAREKSGILRPGCAAVSAPQPPEAEAVLRAAAEAAGCAIRFVREADVEPVLLSPDRTRIRYRGAELSLAMGGDFQCGNLALAAETLAALSEREPLDLGRAFAGISSVALPGRFQRVSSRPDTFFDAGHNPSGTAALCRTLDRHFPGRPLYCVMAMYRDKDYRTCAAAMAERSKVFFAANTDSPRALPAETLAEIARTRCRDVRVLPDAAEALTEARRAAGPDGLVLVCGSFAHLSRAFSALPAKKTPSRKGSAQRTDP